jgi:hypothetical protein
MNNPEHITKDGRLTQAGFVWFTGVLTELKAFRSLALTIEQTDKLRELSGLPIEPRLSREQMVELIDIADANGASLKEFIKFVNNDAVLDENATPRD